MLGSRDDFVCLILGGSTPVIRAILLFRTPVILQCYVLLVAREQCYVLLLLVARDVVVVFLVVATFFIDAD